jgi:SAM-dependent methyltransferase
VNSSGDPGRDAEAKRVGRVYARYGRSRRRRRAWAADNPGNRAIRAELLAAVLDEAGPQLRSGGEVLDAGCGTGYWLEALRDSGVEPGRLSGVELQPQRAAAAAQRVPGATVTEADVRKLPFEDDRFAVVLLFTVLSSLKSSEDVRGALSEATRVLDGGGVLLCYEPRYANPLNGQVRRVTRADFDAGGVVPRTTRELTLLPPLARVLGGATAALYPRLVAAPPLRSHRLTTHRPQFRDRLV